MLPYDRSNKAKLVTFFAFCSSSSFWVAPLLSSLLISLSVSTLSCLSSFHIVFADVSAEALIEMFGSQAAQLASRLGSAMPRHLSGIWATVICIG